MDRMGRKELRGSLIGGRYRVIRPLGQGGMAFVYLAYDEQKRREVAVKLMREELMGDPEFVRRFATEARAAASLDHPNIVHVLDYGQDEDLRYIVQEYVEGTTLKDLIYEKGGLTWELAVPLMIQISLALEHAHARGIIHRDMKPQNVLVTPDMIAKVTDFGIARAAAANTITLTGGVAFGSVHYFSPEQARGGQVTVRSDLYSLGIMLYEMLLAELPFDGESSVAVAIKQLQEMPRRPSSIKSNLPRGLDDIIFRAIQKNPERRYTSAADFANELDAFMIDPNGVYGVIPKNVSANPDAPATSALGLQKQESNYSKVREIEEKISRRRRSRLLSSTLVFLVIVASIIGFTSLIYYGYQSVMARMETVEPEKEFVVERYIGKELTDVRPALEDQGFTVEVKYEKNATVQMGYIFRQEPDAGIKLREEERHVILYVSQGEARIEVPNLENHSVKEAKDKLKSLGFDVVERHEYSPDVKKGELIRTNPAAHDLAPEGATVYVYISDGDKKTVMPEIPENATWAQLIKLMDEANLQVQAVRVASADGKPQPELPENQRVILSISVEAGTELPSGSRVSVTYGDAEDEEEKEEEEKDKPDPAQNEPGRQIVMPNIKGTGWGAGRSELINAGINPNNIAVRRTTEAQGKESKDLYVLYQTPASGTTVDTQRTPIEVTVGTYNDWVNSLNKTEEP